MTVTATKISPTEYRHASETWSETLPLDELDGQLRFYSGMAERYPPQYTDHVEALGALKKILEGK